MDPIRKKREHGDTSEEDGSHQKIAKTEESTIPLSQQYVYYVFSHAHMYVRMHAHMCINIALHWIYSNVSKHTYVCCIIVQKVLYTGQAVQCKNYVWWERTLW